ncbi:hypothetical protein [Falsiroseomonas sp. HW251]|uniref:DUF5983 family protein n=1 Tax=Falsiroseomonas sp. HW251 TaxID=3390998 RepID=UPI003D31CE45
MHIDGRDDEILAELAPRERRDHPGAAPPFRIIEHGWGFIVDAYAEDFREASEEALALGFSERFLALLDYARRQGCRWVNLDFDADSIEGLESGDWP